MSTSIPQDPETTAKLNKLRETLGMPTAPAAPETSEDVPSPEFPELPDAPQTDGGLPVTEPQIVYGSDVDWSEFDLKTEIAHLYPRAYMKDTPEGPKWMVDLEMYDFRTAAYSVSNSPQVGKKPRQPALGQIVTEMVNSPEQWRVVSVFANGSGMGVVMFGRKVTVGLPMPSLLKSEADVPVAPTDEELASAEQAGLDWIEREGQTTELPAPLVQFADGAADEAVTALDGPDFGTIPPRDEDVTTERPEGQ